MNLKTREKRKKLVAKFGQSFSEEEILEKLKQSQEKMIRALAGALTTAPDDPEIRSELLEAVEKAMQMRSKIYGMIGETPPKIKINIEELLEEEEIYPQIED